MCLLCYFQFVKNLKDDFTCIYVHACKHGMDAVCLCVTFTKDTSTCCKSNTLPYCLSPPGNVQESGNESGDVELNPGPITGKHTLNTTLIN